MPDGWIILDKPRGLGSTRAVGAVKRNLRQAGFGKVKVGHGGTLDPLAEGVLPIALGEATKLCGRMLDSDKTYAFTIEFGRETDTLDAEGHVVRTSDHRPPIAAIAAVLENFTGAIEQVPPAFSAIKVDGERAYDRARAGEDIDLKPRRVMIHSLAPLRGGDEGEACAGSSVRTDKPHPSPEREELSQLTLLASVSKGTYIRSLARDIAQALGTVGHVTYLRRTKAGPFGEDRAISLDKLNAIGQGARLEDHLLPLEAGLDGIPALPLDPESAQAVRQGRVLSGMPQPDGLYLAKAGNVPVALMEIVSGTAKVVRGFNLSDTAE
jgi:tRNA pseudouridine55 synthase